MYQIYQITNRLNGKVYIGMTRNGLRVRWNAHQTSSRRGSSAKFHNAIRKYGSDSFDVTVIASDLTQAQAVAREIALILRFDSFNNGYNSTEGGDIVDWFDDASPEHRLRVIERRRAGIRRYMASRTEDKIQALRQRTADQWKKQSPEDRDKMSKKMASRKAKRYRVRSPDGQEIEVLNLKAFCIERGLHQGQMSAVANGKHRHCKGWKVEHIG